MTSYTNLTDIPLFRYSMIMADNPWRFETYSDEGRGRSADQHYQTMTLDDLLALPVHQVAAPDCFLWLGITAPMAHLAPTVMHAWGFQPVTMGFWVKTQKANPAKPKIGMGYVLRECGEPYFIGKIGNPGFRDPCTPTGKSGIPSVIMAQKREHSRKPEAAYAHAERMTPANGWRLDLFSRQTREGWDNAGFEATKFDLEAERT